MRISIVSCARCGKDHDVVFYKFTNPPPRYTHYGICVVNSEPILLLIEDDGKDDD